MKKLFITTGVFIISLLLFTGLKAEDKLILHSFYYRALANNPGEMISVLRKITVNHNGYVKYFSNNKITIRIPVKHAMVIKGHLAETGYIVDEQVFRKDVSEELLDLRTRLKVKQKLMENLNNIFNDSLFIQTLDVERELGKVIVEIEKIKGKIAYYKDRAALSEVTVAINSSGGRTSKSNRARTQWDWIRMLGIEKMLKKF